MITDATLLFDSSKAITTAGATFSTDVVDLSMVRDLGDGECLFLLVTVTESFTSDDNGVVQFGLAVSASANMASPAYLVNSGLYDAARLVAVSGNNPATQIVVPLPGLISALNASIGANGSRYMSAVYTSVNNFTAGKVRAELILNPQMLNGRTYYSKSFVID